VRHATSTAFLVGLLSVYAAPVRAAVDLLDGREVVALTLAAPFQDLFDHADDDDYKVVGRLTYDDPASRRRVTLDGVTITLRGNTSRRTSECGFPKLKVAFDMVPRESTAVAGLAALKLGTHCDERSDADLTPKYGRLANERAPHREALVYDMLEAAGVPTLRARPARVTYIRTDIAPSEPLVRNAMLLEDDEDARTRLGAAGEIEEGAFTSALERFAVRDTARLAFAQALIGNFDWCLRFFPGDTYRCDDRRPLWNVLALVRNDRSVLPVMYDFDLAGPVVGRHVWFEQVFDASFAPSGSATDVEVLAQVQRTRSLFSRDILDATRRTFLDTRAAVYDVIRQAMVDPQGRAQAMRYADSFYSAIEDDTRFYLPVLAEEGVLPATGADGARPACPDAPPAPTGTPTSAPLERHGDMVRVRLLDALWHWTGSARCDAVHRQAVWVPSQAIGTEYPR
jgi:hypothetical protein